MAKKLMVLTKYGENGRFRIGSKIVRLGGVGHFCPREHDWVNEFPTHLHFKLKLFNLAHLHGEHGTPLGRKHPCWERANKRFEDRYKTTMDLC